MAFNNFTLKAAALCLVIMLAVAPARAQLTVTDNQTAAILAQKLVGSGVTMLNPTLNCPGASNAVFEGVSNLGIDSGIVLCSGQAATSGINTGVNGPFTGAYPALCTGGFTPSDDVDLEVISGQNIYDACILQFDFVPTGDTIKFDYVFGSAEYDNYSCSGFNDAFGFFISGPGITGIHNIAIVPGTGYPGTATPGIPVTVNSTTDPVAMGAFSTAQCTAMGPGSPFSQYFVNNQTPPGATITLPGFTQVFTALHAVTPCDTYHLKLAIADASDCTLDSDVFLKAGSLTSAGVVVAATGGSVITGVDTPLVVRECLDGAFTFSLPAGNQDTIIIKYNIVGSAVNGIDYTVIPDSLILYPGEDTAMITIHSVITSPASADTEYVTLEVLSPFLCANGLPNVVATSTIMILNNLPVDAFANRDTVCPGGDAQLNVTLGQLSCGLSNLGCGAGNNPSDFYAGTESNVGFTPTPYGVFPLNKGDRMQFLYTRDELRALGMEPGFILNTGFNIATKGSTDTFKDFTIRMACTSDPYLGGNDFKSFTNVTQVLPPGNVLTVPGWNNYNFPTPYYWDGNSNIVMEICWEKDSFVTPGQADLVYYTNTGFQSTMYMSGGFAPTTGNPDPCNSNDESGANTTNNKRPNTRFSFCPKSNYSFAWTPTTFLDDPTIQSPLATGITGNSVTYSVTVTNALLPNCVSTDAVTVGVDNSNSIDATPQNPAIVCSPGYLQLNALAQGLAPLYNLPCGTTNTQNCATPDSIVLGNQPSAPSDLDNTPYLSNQNYNEYQFVIPRSEILAAGMNSATLRSLSFLGQGGPNLTNPLTNFRIALKCSPRTQFPANASDGDFETGATTVYTSASQGITPSGWNKFVFQQPYNWDTTQNLIVQICLGPQTPNFPGNNPVAMTFGSALQKSGTTDVCDATNGATVSSFTQRPIVKLGYCPAPPAPFQYTWEPGVFLSDSGIANPVAYIEQPTTYYVSTVGRNGCRVEDSVVIKFPSHNYSLTPVDTSICPGDRVLYQVYGSGITGYAWTQGNFETTTSLSCTNCDNPVATPPVTTNYQVIINDALNCPDTLYARIVVFPVPPVDILNNDTTIRYGDNFMLIVRGGVEFSWTPANSLSDPRIPNPIASPTEPTQYIVTSISVDGCVNRDTINVDIDYRDEITVPTAFTPNADGLNDVFRVAGMTNQRLMEFRVYNRWGKEVYNTTDPRGGWDGTYNGVPQDMAVYKYLIKVAFPDGATETFKGDVTLVR